MKIAPLPENEELRLMDLSSYDILNSVEEKEFDDLVELVSLICKCPMAAISFIDKDRQWFKSAKGLQVKETSREIAFCAHTILQNDVFLVKNATKDKRFSDSPLVVRDMNVHFYAGYPIVSSAGYKLGAVCVMNTKPYRLSQEQEKTLSIISGQVARLLELRLKNNLIKKQAYKLLEIEQKTIQHNLAERDNERQMIGTQLEENFAQVLTSVSLYLGMSQKMEELMVPCISKAKEQVDYLLNNIHNLTKSIVPTTLKGTSLKEMVSEFISRFQNAVRFSINFLWEGKNEVKGNIAFSLFRIIETHLFIIRMKENVHNVSIKADVKENEVSLIIKDDGKIDRSMELELMMNTIIKRIEMHNGKFNILNNKPDGRTLTIILPLVYTTAN
jgi:signal transduction histidine kinase